MTFCLSNIAAIRCRFLNEFWKLSVLLTSCVTLYQLYATMVHVLSTFSFTFTFRKTLIVFQVERHVADALSKGAKLLRGGHRHELGQTFFEPTILTDVNTDMLVCKEETFGPVAPLIRYIGTSLELYSWLWLGLVGTFLRAEKQTFRFAFTTNL